MYETLSHSFSTLKVEGMRAVEHEDKEDNDDYAVDPMADPRLDRFDLFNMVDSRDRDAVLNATRGDAVALNDDDDPTFQPPVQNPAPDAGSTGSSGD